MQKYTKKTGSDDSIRKIRRSEDGKLLGLLK